MNNKQRVLFVVLAIVGVLLTLQINGALAAETTPIKCDVPAMMPGGFDVPGDNVYRIRFMFPFTVTVLETLDKPGTDEDGKKITIKAFRFSANYDKPVLANWCPIHLAWEPIPYELYSKTIPAAALDRFLVAVEHVVCK